MGLFGAKAGGADAGTNAARIPRHSSGWVQMTKYMRAEESLRVLDFGPTSAGNINFVTSLGHSIYMANLVDDAARTDYLLPAADGEPAAFDTERFMSENLDFQGRTFNVVLLWDTLDYLPLPLIQPIADRLFEVMSPGGQLLALFHAGAAPGAIQKSKAAADETTFSRYHLTDGDQLELQRIGGRPILHTQTNRQVEAAFHLYSGYKFFLAKDSLREVIVTR
jgi:hypothetical protein